jgi:hypothetical protein
MVIIFLIDVKLRLQELLRFLLKFCQVLMLLFQLIYLFIFPFVLQSWRDLNILFFCFFQQIFQGLLYFRSLYVKLWKRFLEFIDLLWVFLLFFFGVSNHVFQLIYSICKVFVCSKFIPLIFHLQFQIINVLCLLFNLISHLWKFIINFLLVLLFIYRFISLPHLMVLHLQGLEERLLNFDLLR